MDVHEMRFRNFRELFKKFQQKESDDGIAGRGALKRFGEFTGVSPFYLSHINNERKAIGAATARQIEAAFHLQPGWMDNDHLEGMQPMDAAAREFGELAMRLYRDSPDEARMLLMRYMADKIFNVEKKKEPSQTSEQKKDSISKT